MKLCLSGLLVALLAASCGATTHAGTTPPGGGRLTVVERGTEPCCYVEGYVRFLRIESDGVTLFDGRWDEGRPFTRAMPAGIYRVTRYLRPCEGTCAALDPPSERCSVNVRIDAEEDLRITVLPKQLGSCRLLA